MHLKSVYRSLKPDNLPKFRSKVAEQLPPRRASDETRSLGSFGRKNASPPGASRTFRALCARVRPRGFLMTRLGNDDTTTSRSPTVPTTAVLASIYPPPSSLMRLEPHSARSHNCGLVFSAATHANAPPPRVLHAPNSPTDADEPRNSAALSPLLSRNYFPRNYSRNYDRRAFVHHSASNNLTADGCVTPHTFSSSPSVRSRDPRALPPSRSR